MVATVFNYQSINYEYQAYNHYDTMCTYLEERIKTAPRKLKKRLKKELNKLNYDISMEASIIRSIGRSN